MALLIQICLLINKWLLPDHRQLIQATSNRLMHNLTDETIPSNTETAANSLRLLLYLSKAIILRLDSLTTPLLDNLLTLLSHPNYGLPAARGFSILLGPHDLLTSTNFLVTRQLHKQRAFYQCMPRLTSDIRTAPAETKPNYLIALAGIIHSIPTEIIMPQLDTLLPLLLQSIDLPANPGVKEASIQTLSITIRDAPKVVEGYISSLITRLLSSSTTRTPTSSSNTNPPVSCLVPSPLSLSLSLSCIFQIEARNSFLGGKIKNTESPNSRPSMSSTIPEIFQTRIVVQS